MALVVQLVGAGYSTPTLNSVTYAANASARVVRLTPTIMLSGSYVWPGRAFILPQSVRASAPVADDVVMAFEHSVPGMPRGVFPASGLVVQLRVPSDNTQPPLPLPPPTVSA